MAKTAIEKRKPTRLFFAITRVLRGEENGTPFRVPEGYAYVNAWVGDGVDLTRSSMVGASDNYMRWGNVREMHQPSAVGTAVGSVEIDGESLPLGVAWDENGAFLRSKIVDPTAIIKLDEGVYKGYSVGVRPKVMRGNSVIECDWFETSLVDRPADPDAVISLARVADVPEEFDVLRYWDENDNWIEGPYTFGQRVPGLKADDVADDVYSACYALVDSLRSIIAGGGDVALMQQSVDEFATYLKGDVIGEADTGRSERIQNAIARFIAKPTTEVPDNGELLTRATLAETNLTATTTERDTLRLEVETLRAKLAGMPSPTQPQPAKFAPAERTFTANQWADGQPVSEQAKTLKEEFATLARTLKDEPNDKKRYEGVLRMQTIKAELAQMGEGV